MSNEEFQRKMDFIVGQQAQFVSDMQVLRESQAQTDNVVARLAYVTHAGFNDVNAKINALVDGQIRNEEQLKLTEERFNEKLARSEERFNEKLARSDERFIAKMDAMNESFNAMMAESDQRFNEKMDRLREAQARTDESLRNLIEGQNRSRLRANGREPEESDHEH